MSPSVILLGTLTVAASLAIVVGVELEISTPLSPCDEKACGDYCTSLRTFGQCESAGADNCCCIMAGKDSQTQGCTWSNGACDSNACDDQCLRLTRTSQCVQGSQCLCLASG